MSRKTALWYTPERSLFSLEYKVRMLKRLVEKYK